MKLWLRVSHVLEIRERVRIRDIGLSLKVMVWRFWVVVWGGGVRERVLGKRITGRSNANPRSYKPYNHLPTPPAIDAETKTRPKES